MLNFYLSSIHEVVDKFEMSVVQPEEEGDMRLYLCLVVVTNPCSGRLAVEERQADITLVVNRALTRIVHKLMRRHCCQYSI